jgi:hypothetical protein
VKLFGKAAQRENDQREQLRAARRGRLSAALWESDPTEQAYIDEALQINREWLGALREMQSPEWVPQPASWWIENMLPKIAQFWDLNEIVSAPNSAYVLSEAETWTELDPAEVDRLIDAAGEAATSRLSSDFTNLAVCQSFAAIGVIRSHLESPSPVPEAEPLYCYLAGQPSYGRLERIRDHMETIDSVSLPAMTDEQHEMYGRSFRKAWHLGVVLEVFSRLDRLPDRY